MVRRIRNILEVTHYMDFILEGMGQIALKGGEQRTPEELMNVFKRNIESEQFGFFIAYKDGKPIGFVASFISENIFLDVEAFVWTMYCKPGSPTKSLEKAVVEWMQSWGVERINALNGLMEEHKRKWLKRMGFTTRFELCERKL